MVPFQAGFGKHQKTPYCQNKAKIPACFGEIPDMFWWYCIGSCVPSPTPPPGQGGGNTAASMDFKYNGIFIANIGIIMAKKSLCEKKRYIKSQGLRPWLSSVLSVSNVLCVLARVGWWQGSWSTNRSSEGAQIGTSTGSSIVDQSQKQSRSQSVV